MNHLTRSVSVLLFASITAAGGCSKEAAASGPSGVRLALTQPANQTICRGESNTIAISIDRKGFADAVTIGFTNLPAGVTVAGEDMKVAAGSSSKDFVLVASPEATLIESKVVTVSAKVVDVSVSQTFDLTVKPAK